MGGPRILKEFDILEIVSHLKNYTQKKEVINLDEESSP
jgi:hypothetical protein